MGTVSGLERIDGDRQACTAVRRYTRALSSATARLAEAIHAAALAAIDEDLVVAVRFLRQAEDLHRAQMGLIGELRDRIGHPRDADPAQGGV